MNSINIPLVSCLGEGDTAVECSCDVIICQFTQSPSQIKFYSDWKQYLANHEIKG